MIDGPAGSFGQWIVGSAVQLHSEGFVSRSGGGQNHRLLGTCEHGSAVEKIGVGATDAAELSTEEAEGEVRVPRDWCEENTGFELE